MQNKEEKQEIDKRIGKRFKELIHSRGLTQQKVADAIPLSKQSISNICSGKQDITPNVSRFADLLGVSTDYLLCRSDYKTEEEMLHTVVKELNVQGERSVLVGLKILEICEEKGFRFLHPNLEKYTEISKMFMYFSAEYQPKTMRMEDLTEEEKEKGTLIEIDYNDYNYLLEDVEEYINQKLCLLVKRKGHTKITPEDFRDSYTVPDGLSEAVERFQRTHPYTGYKIPGSE